MLVSRQYSLKAESSQAVRKKTDPGVILNIYSSYLEPREASKSFTEMTAAEVEVPRKGKEEADDASSDGEVVDEPMEQGGVPQGDELDSTGDGARQFLKKSLIK